MLIPNAQIIKMFAYANTGLAYANPARGDVSKLQPARSAAVPQFHGRKDRVVTHAPGVAPARRDLGLAGDPDNMWSDVGAK